MTDLTVNGEAVSITGRHASLLGALRDELRLTSAKDGCSPSGQCGCCTVLIDGKARVSCQTPVEKLAGATITTLEGLDPVEVGAMADAFAACGALQCGFCTPGIVVRTKALLDRKGADLTRDDAARHLGAHLCRCTGYVKILDAVEALASGAVPPVVQPGGIGSSGIKYEGRELAAGSRPFIDDLQPEGCLHGALRLADHARADVVRIDTAAARAVPGVEAVLTAADVPGALRVGLIHKDWPVLIPEGGRTSYLGDVLAVVVATDRETAREAAALVAVEYRPLRTISDPVRAVEDDEDAVWGLDGNVLSRSTYRRGDVDAALAASAHTVHEVFQTQRVEHAFVEPESTLAAPTPDGGLHVWSGGQGIWDDRDDIAAVLGIDGGRVTVELVSNGGAFGGKEDMSNQAQAALAAWLLQRPVKITLSREESFLVHPKRHPIRMEYWAGCDDEGG
jgi:xanthine dehydrogenase molybdenum-binding subunit